MSAPTIPPKACYAEVRGALEMRQQVAEALHSPVVFVPAMYSTSPRLSTPVEPEALDFMPRDLQAFACALLAPPAAPNARLLAAKRKAKEWLG